MNPADSASCIPTVGRGELARVKKPGSHRWTTVVISLNSKYVRDAVTAGLTSLREAGIDPSPALLESIATYIELLLRWNQKLNLTTIRDPREMVSRNFSESFLAMRWLQDSGGVLLDIGSGAGFPGLALKLLLPSWKLILIEPNTKKCAFLSEAARTLGLSEVRVERARWQDLQCDVSCFTTITCRALGDHAELIRWARERLAPGGRLILWLGARDADEISTLGGWNWERVTVPGSRERVILAGMPQR